MTTFITANSGRLEKWGGGRPGGSELKQEFLLPGPGRLEHLDFVSQFESGEAPPFGHWRFVRALGEYNRRVVAVRVPRIAGGSAQSSIYG
jgi:hypothetical protein